MSSNKSLVINCGASHVAAALFTVSGGKLRLDELVTRELRYDHGMDDAWLPAVGEAMRDVHQDKTRATLAHQATGWVKPLAMLAGGIINGRGAEADIDYIMTH